MVTKSATLKIRGGCDRDCHGKKAGKGALIQWEKSGTLGVSQDQTLFVWYTPSKGGVRSNGGQGGNGWRPNVMYTLDSAEVHAVCYGVDLYSQTTTGGGINDCDIKAV